MASELAYTQTGDGPDLVLIHGWAMNSGVWTDVVGRLSDRYRVTAVDLPGHGQSPVLADGSLESWSEAVLAIAPTSAIWLGWSLGGLVAMSCAASHPQRIKRLVLVGATPCFVVRDDWCDAVSDDIFTAFAAELERDTQSAWQRFLALQLRGTKDARTHLRRLRDLVMARGEAGIDALRDGLAILRTTDLRDRLSSIECDVQCIYGARDTMIPESSSAAMAKLVPHIVSSTIAACGHAPFLSHQDEFLALLEEHHV